MHQIQYRQVFHDADEGMKGFLNYEDVKIAIMIMFGHKISKCEAVELMNLYGSQQESGVMGMSQVQFEKAVMEGRFKIDHDEKIRNTFMMFDRCCRGFLIMDDVKSVFREVCPHFLEHRVEMAFRELDCDSDGRISYKDFDLMMKFDHLY
uniref:EF-hand domain-containing protein n=2 Tax=Arion vulgaris TaxID=1028688 RepID=A0A0B7APR9_9EUPU